MPPAYPIRRRPRECKTCLPCRAGKVRCDRNVPCGNCVKRNQPADCVYGRPPPQFIHPDDDDAVLRSVFSHRHLLPHNCLQQQQQQQQQPPPPPPPSHDTNPHADTYDSFARPFSDPVNISQEEWDQICSKVTAMEEIIDSLRSLFHSNSIPSSRPTTTAQFQTQPPQSSSLPESERDSPPRSEGVYGPNDSHTDSIHVGSRCALVDIIEKSKDSDKVGKALPKDNLLTELALGNESAAYPFADLWSSDPFNFDIAGVCSVLPNDQQCLRFFSFYRDIGAVLYPVIPNINRFEQIVNQLLQGRASAGGVYKPDPNGPLKPFGVSLAFLSLFFAVLASGCQLSDAPRRERDMTSWVYVSCSYQCLRMINYVARPTVEVIQILLIICNVLSYNMNAGASYTLLGMTERLCMILGLHVDSTHFTRPQQDARRQVWWAMAFQNSHFSLAYDRPSITMVSQPEIPFNRKSMPGYRSYFETLCRVVQLALDVLRGRMTPHHPRGRYHEIREFQQRMQRVLAEAVPHLHHRERCTTLAQHIERAELRLHSSYVISVLCRSSLDPSCRLDSEQRAIVRAQCIESLLSTVEAFVDLHSHNSHSSRSWISLQRAIASAFLLVAHEDGQSHPRTWDLIEELEVVLADHVEEKKDSGHGNDRTASANHLASSLHAFQEISASVRAGKMKVQQQSSVPKPMTTMVPAKATMGHTSTSQVQSQNILLPSPMSMENSPVNRTDTTMAYPPVPTGNKNNKNNDNSINNNNANGDGNEKGKGNKQSLKRCSWDMQNVLGRVSEVMLFPSLSNNES